ncbi:hypothetical protein PV797_03445 [Clostridiaceae bacterium M8S5]|nr:hypothetical protein PV797_03445 [Clostridiaceae bacterium M8S5]
MKNLKKSKKAEYTLYIAGGCSCGCWPSKERVDNKLSDLEDEYH